MAYDGEHGILHHVLRIVGIAHIAQAHGRKPPRVKGIEIAHRRALATANTFCNRFLPTLFAKHRLLFWGFALCAKVV